MNTDALKISYEAYRTRAGAAIYRELPDPPKREYLIARIGLRCAYILSVDSALGRNRTFREDRDEPILRFFDWFAGTPISYLPTMAGLDFAFCRMAMITDAAPHARCRDEQQLAESWPYNPTRFGAISGRSALHTAIEYVRCYWMANSPFCVEEHTLIRHLMTRERVDSIRSRARWLMLQNFRDEAEFIGEYGRLCLLMRNEYEQATAHVTHETVGPHIVLSKDDVKRCLNHDPTLIQEQDKRSAAAKVREYAENFIKGDGLLEELTRDRIAAAIGISGGAVSGTATWKVIADIKRREKMRPVEDHLLSRKLRDGDM